MAEVGRPTVYSNEVLSKTQHYIDNFDQDPYNDKMPMIVGLALALKIHKDTIYEWIKHDDKKEFSDLVGNVLQKQEKVLFNNGLDGTFNAPLTKLALTKHGYSDKQDATIGNPDGTNLAPSTDIEIARKLAFVLDKALKDKEPE